MRLLHAITAGIFIVATGCASQDVVIQKQAELEARLEYLVQTSNATNARITALSNELKDLNEKMQANSFTPRELKDSGTAPPAAASEPQQGSPSTVPQVSAKIEVINQDTTTREKSDAISAAYMEAFGLYSANDYAAAIKAFSVFLEKHPDTEYAVNAQYWIGECYYSQSNLSLALDSFRKVVEKYPKGKKVPDALLKTGYTLIAMKETEKGRAVLASLVEKYPNSPAAAKAKERLRIQ